MNLISLDFITFAIITLIVYFFVPKKYRWLVLAISSIRFYYVAGIKALIVLVVASLGTFFSAIIIERIPVGIKKRKILLATSVMLIAMWLMFTKASRIDGVHFHLSVVPLGISYVSFMLISYLVDIYWEKDCSDKNFFRFLLYILFFPKISQGPITKHKDLAKQLYEGGQLSYKALCSGIQRMIYGYFKKVVIADRAAMFTEPVFADIHTYSGSIIVIATMLAALQLYCDFSGYMDIVLGFTEAIGLKMDENFRHPFFSRSVAEFWRRWHITLGVWFKDYVYTPIAMAPFIKKIGKWGRKKIGKRFGNSFIKVIALSVVWILTGIWHGTGINYILWGTYWGVIIILSAVFESEIGKINSLLNIRTSANSWKIFQMLRTFLIFSFGILLTKLNSLQDYKAATYNIFKQFKIWNLFDGTLYSFGMDKTNFYIMIFALIVVWTISILQEKISVREKISELNAPVRWVIYAGSISIVLFLGIYGSAYNTSSFAYTNF